MDSLSADSARGIQQGVELVLRTSQMLKQSCYEGRLAAQDQTALSSWQRRLEEYSANIEAGMRQVMEQHDKMRASLYRQEMEIMTERQRLETERLRLQDAQRAAADETSTRAAIAQLRNEVIHKLDEIKNAVSLAEINNSAAVSSTKYEIKTMLSSVENELKSAVKTAVEWETRELKSGIILARSHAASENAIGGSGISTRLESLEQNVMAIRAAQEQHSTSLNALLEQLRAQNNMTAMWNRQSHGIHSTPTTTEANVDVEELALQDSHEELATWIRQAQQSIDSRDRS